MALSTLKCNHLMPLPYKGLIHTAIHIKYHAKSNKIALTCLNE